MKQKEHLTQVEKDALATREIARMVDSVFPEHKPRGLRTLSALTHTPFHVAHTFSNILHLSKLNADGTDLRGLDLYSAAVKQLAYRAVYVSADDLKNYVNMTDDDLADIGIADLDGLVAAVRPRDDEAIGAALGGVPPNDAILPLVLISALMKIVYTHKCQAGTASRS